MTFDLSALVGSPIDLPAKATAAGVTASPLTRVGVAATSSSGAMNASNWPTGARDTGKHYVFSVSPPAGCTLSVTSLAIDIKASSTGPTKTAVGSSADGFAAVTGFAVTTAGGSISVPLAGIQQMPGNLELHIYGWSASSTAGTLRIESALSLTGTLAPL